MAEPGKEAESIVAGKYRVTTMVGRGGMGSVWEGLHVNLGTRVAIKFIDAEHAQSKEAQSRFVNEARAAAKLRSKHVVQVHDQGITDDGRPYIVMEFLSGEPLDRRLERVGALSLQQTAVIIGQVCRALGKAHEAGIVHRDLKPENVFIVVDEEDGHELVKVVDFGIAKFTDTSFGMSSATRTGSVLGTPYYMSPEQARGLRSVDHRADLWSIGVIAFRCVAGRLPFEGEAIGDLLVKICTAPLPVPSQIVPGLPPSFDAWFHRALGREPAERFQSAHELADALAAVAGLPSARAPLTAEASSTYPVPQGPWAGSAPTPGSPAQGALTGAPITTHTHSATLQSSSSGRGLLLAGIGAAALVGLVVLAVIIRLAVGGSAKAEPDLAASASSVPAAASVGTAPPEVVPSVGPDTAKPDAAVAQPEVEPAKPESTSAKPAAPTAKSPGATKTTPGPAPRPRPKDPGDVLGY